MRDFIEDKNYIFNLKEKYAKKCEKKESNEKNDFLGFKRKRFKEDKITYDDELKLLENDYPQIIENDNDEIGLTNVKIKKEKLSDAEEELNQEINDVNNIVEDKIKESINENNNIKQKIKEKEQIEPEIKNNNINKNHKNNKIKNISKENINLKINKSSIQRPKASKTRKKKAKNISIKKSLNVYSPKKVLNNNNINNNSYDYFNSSNNNSNSNSNSNRKYNNNALNMLNGINSRLDKMPKINIFKKKKYLTNFSAEKLLDNIQEQLANIDSKNSKNSSNNKRYLSDDKIKMKKLNKYVNKNFYGKERLKSPSFPTSDESLARNDENNINIIKNKIDDNFIDFGDVMKDMFNNKKKDNNNTIKDKKANSKKNINNIIKKDSISKRPKVFENKNVSIMPKIILSYANNKKKGEKIITKVEFIPDSIIIDKSAIEMKEIKSLFASLFPSKASKKEIINIKNNTQNKEIKNEKTKKTPKPKKPQKTPVVKSKKYNIVQKPRRSSRIRNALLKKNFDLVDKVQRMRKKFSKKRITKYNKNKKEKKEIKKEIKKEEKESIKKEQNESIKKEEKEIKEEIKDKKVSLGVCKIKTNYNNKLNNELLSNGNDEILALKTLRDCDDTKSDGDRYIQKGKSKLKDNHTVIGESLDMEEMLKGFNYLYNQK